MKNFRAKYGDKWGISNCVEGCYASVYLWAAAVEAAGTDDPEDMLDVLPTITVDSPAGPLQISAENNHAILHSYIAECQEDGQFNVLVDLGMIEPKTACKFD